MPNSYFQFKQFVIQQDKAAMKVCTDACLFGAWLADTIQEGKIKIRNILDVGTGTGLIALMLAQRFEANIVAVEIDASAALQAKENFARSKFSERIHLLNADVRDMKTDSTFDLIAANPPFYSGNLKSEDTKRNLALHSDALKFDELINSVKKVLRPSGIFAVLLPFSRAHSFVSAAKEQLLFLEEQLLVKQTENHSYFRCMCLFSRSESVPKTSELVIKSNGLYSKEFTQLLKDYYLHF